MKLEIDTETKIITVVECEPGEIFVFNEIGDIFSELSQGLYMLGIESFNEYIEKEK